MPKLGFVDMSRRAKEMKIKVFQEKRKGKLQAS
jgi:hypothetical protein